MKTPERSRKISEAETLYAQGAIPNLKAFAARYAVSVRELAAIRKGLADKAALSGYCAFVERAGNAFGDSLTASRWLSTPSADLDGMVPLELAQSVQYSPSELQRIFDPVFVRIEHGVYE